MTPRPIVVGGALAAKPGNGGEAWVRMSWVTGLRRLGYDAWFVEEVDPGTPSRATAAAWFRAVVRRFGLDDRAVLVTGSPDETPTALAGPDVDVGELLGEAGVLLNISGNVRHPSLLARVRRAAYVDLDPGFTQIWAARGHDLGLERHDAHLTVGELVGTPVCPLPTAGYTWRPCRQPVVLDDWPVLPVPAAAPFTTVATWRCAHGSVEWGGTAYGSKHHGFRRVVGLAARAPFRMELALDLHEDDAADGALLRDAGWRVRASPEVARSPDAFRRYVQGSAGEFSVAQGVYGAGTGWFSDRTARYLATGRPAVVQDTGWCRAVGVDDGVLAFDGEAAAAAALERVAADPQRHSRAARRLAEEIFAAERVLPRTLEAAGYSP